PDDTGLVQIAQERVGYVRNVASDFFRSKLGVASFDFKLFDVDRSVIVFLDQLFADEDGVFEVVTAPRHERNKDVSAEREFAHISAGSIGQNLTLHHTLTLECDRLLVD